MRNVPVGSNATFARRVAAMVLAVSASTVLTGCSSGGSAADPSLVSRESTGDATDVDTSTDSTDSTEASGGSGIPKAKGAVSIEYFLTKTSSPVPQPETPVKLDGPTKQLTMDISNISYTGVVCGFTFVGTQPAPPLNITMTVEQADGTLVAGKVPISWGPGEGGETADSSGFANDGGWMFLGDAQANRRGPGWVVQVGAISTDGDRSGPPPKNARCVLDSDAEIPAASGPVNMWAGFATE
jgi:hypothetical protein